MVGVVIGEGIGIVWEGGIWVEGNEVGMVEVEIDEVGREWE